MLSLSHFSTISHDIYLILTPMEGSAACIKSAFWWSYFQMKVAHKAEWTDHKWLLREDIHRKSSTNFGHCLKKGEGGLPMPEFWSLFFRQKIVPKTSLFVLKRNNICMFFGQFCHHYRQNDHYNYQCNHHNHHWYFFSVVCAKRCLTAGKKGPSCPNWGGGGGGGGVIFANSLTGKDRFSRKTRQQ